MPMEIREGKIIMRAGKYNQPKCCCGEPWRLNTVHREKTPCFDYIAHEWVGLTDKELQDVWPFVFKPHELRNKAIYQAIEAKLKEKNT